MAKRSPALEARRSELIVLLLLMEHDLTGYELRARIKDWNIHLYLPVSATTIYRALQRLEGEGCLGGMSRKSGNYPVSTVYSITEKGREKYRAHLLAESVFTRTPYAVDAFLGLAAYLGAPERKQIVHNWQENARQRIEALDARINDKVPGAGRTYGKPFSEWLLLDHERDMLRAELAWMEKYLGMF